MTLPAHLTGITVTIQDLAYAYIIEVNRPGREDRDTLAWHIYQEMCRRCGDTHTIDHLNQAREIYKMLVPEPEG